MSLNKQNLINAAAFPTQARGNSSLIGRRQSLRWRLLQWLGVILLFTLLIIGLGVSGFVSQTEQTAWEGRQGEASRNAAAAVAAFVQRVNTTLNAIGLLGRNDLKSEPELLLRLINDNPALLEVIYLDRDGHLLANVHQDASVLAALFTIPQSNWFRHARNGEHYLGDLQLSPNNEPYVVMAGPAPDGGVVAARLQMKVLGATIAAIKLGTTGQAYVINQAGQVIAHTDAKVTLANMNLGERPELIAALQATSNQWTGAYINFEGTAVVGATAPVPDTDWVVITELAQTEAFAVTRRAAWLLGGGMLIFGALALTITTQLLGRVIFQPMEKLQAGAQRIGQGDLTHRITFVQQDEVGQVAQAFNEMADQLRNREEQLVTQTVELATEVSERKKAEDALQIAHDQLEIRVQKRTIELAEANAILRVEIVERVRAETALRESEARYKILFDTVPIAIFTKDSTGCYTSANANALGYWPRNPVGYTDIELISPDVAEQLRADDLQVLATGKLLVFEEHFDAPHGSRIMLSHKMPLYDANNNVIGILGASLDITERKRAEDQIKASLEEKVVLLQEIHHRVKNNLQVISSLLYLQAGKIQDPQMLSILRDSQNRVKSMALIHEKLYQTKDLAKVDLGEYIHNLASYLFRSYTAHAGAIQLQVQADNVFLGIDTAVPCGLIINELVSNALKHAFPDNASGEIQIELRVDGAFNPQPDQEQPFILSVRDSGVGFPADIDFQNTASLGLQLVNTLVNQLDGTIELHYNKGTEFKIQFPNPT